MTPVKEIGECTISVGDDEFMFRPSFRAMMRIGEPDEIVKTFYDLHNDEILQLMNRAKAIFGCVPGWLINHVSSPNYLKPSLLAAMSVLTACCDQDVTRLVGEIIPGRTGKWAFVYRKGALPLNDMIVVAQSLITHGVIGKAKIRKLQKYDSRESTGEFHAYEYIMAARSHFGISRSEAEELTMTEFQMMLSDKYPDQKGYTKEEYDAEADKYFERRKRRLAKAA